MCLAGLKVHTMCWTGRTLVALHLSRLHLLVRDEVEYHTLVQDQPLLDLYLASVAARCFLPDPPESESFLDEARSKLCGSLTLLSHHARWHGPKDQICTTCAKGFVAIKDLRRHEKTHKPAEHEFFCETLGCAFRTRGFARKDHYVRHLKTHGTFVTPLDAIPGFPATF